MTLCLIGHRGASADKPENTQLSFKTAIAHGMTGFELDVVQSNDGIPFVMHDDKVDRTTNGKGNCYDLPWSSIAALDAGSWKGAAFSGEKVAGFEEVLDCFQNQPIFLLIELKGDAHYTGLPQRAANCIKERKMEHQCQVMSFNWDYADAVKNENPGCITGILGSGQEITNAIARANSRHQFISWNFADITQEMVEQIHASGMTLNVWTVNNEKDMQRMIDLGVDSISSDDTVLLKSIADKNAIEPIRPSVCGLSPDHK